MLQVGHLVREGGRGHVARQVGGAPHHAHHWLLARDSPRIVTGHQAERDNKYVYRSLCGEHLGAYVPLCHQDCVWCKEVSHQNLLSRKKIEYCIGAT